MLFLQKKLIPFLFFIAPFMGYSQAGFNYAGLTRSLGSQRYQPANLGARDETFGVSVDAAGWVTNSGFTLKGVFDKNGYITEETRNRMVESVGKNFGMNAGYKLGLINLNFRLGELNTSVFIDQQYGASISLTNPKTAGLILLGNRPYKGQTVTEDKIRFIYSGVRSYGVGAGINRDQLKAGIRLKFLQGFSYGELKNSFLSITTSEDAVALDISANYDMAISNTGKYGLLSGKGLGAGLDAGLSYELNDNMTADIAVLDAGFITWRKVDKMVKHVENVHFEGINVANLFSSSTSLDTAVQQAVDSLKGLILPDTINGNQTRMAGTTIRAGVNIKIGENTSIYPQICWIPFSANGYMRLPALNVSIRHNVGEALVFGANVYGGGSDLYGFGLMGGIHAEINGVAAIQFQIMADNILGLFLPSIGRGFSVQAGLGFDILGQ